VAPPLAGVGGGFARWRFRPWASLAARPRDPAELLIAETELGLAPRVKGGGGSDAGLDVEGDHGEEDGEVVNLDGVAAVDEDDAAEQVQAIGADDAVDTDAPETEPEAEASSDDEVDVEPGADDSASPEAAPEPEPEPEPDLEVADAEPEPLSDSAEAEEEVIANLTEGMSEQAAARVLGYSAVSARGGRCS
jgi:hypothetical protein